MIYRRCNLVPDYIPCTIDFSKCVVAPNDCAVTDDELLAGRIVPVSKGVYDHEDTQTFNPLYARGVDFTDVGTILDEVNTSEQSREDAIETHRKLLQAEADKVTSPAT